MVNMDSSTRIKVCGITSVEDALAVTAAGADAIGLVFYPKSPRYVSVETAAEIAACLPPFISITGLFVDADPKDIQKTLDRVPLSLLQFHGNEAPEQCERWGMRYIKAFRVRPDSFVEEMVKPYASACGYLLDSYQKGVPGGTGESFDWHLIPDNLNRPVILAGGLNPDNVSLAISKVKPYGVDVSSGVEMRPGIKDHPKVKAFIKAVS